MVPVRPANKSGRLHYSRGLFTRTAHRTDAAGGSLGSNIGNLLPLLLTAIGLALLQVTFLGKSLLFTLPSYGLIALAAVVAFSRLRSAPLPDRACLWFTVAFAGYIVIRALTSPAPYVARTDLFCVVGAVAVYAIMVTTIRSSTGRIALLVLLLAFAVYHIFVGFVQFGVGQNFIAVPFLERFDITRRASGLYANPDHLAGLLEMLGVFALSIACWSRRLRLTRVIFGYFALACYIGVALTASRGGYLSVAASLVVFGILSAMCLRSGDDPVFRKYRNIAILITLIAMIGGTFWIQQSATLRQRIATIVVPDQTRLDLWRAAVAQWKLQPLVGTGSGTYRFYGREFRAPRMQADPVVVHNDYLHLLCEYGILGFIAFCLFFGAHIRSGWTTFRRYGPQRLATGSLPLSDRLALTIGALSAIAACAMHSVFDFNLHVPANALLMAFIFAVLGSSTRRQARTEDTGVSLAPFGLRLAGALAGLLLLFACLRLLPGEYFAEQARVALQNEHPDEAVALADRALIYERKNPNIYFYLGRGLRALGDDKRQSEKRLTYYDAAVSAFDHARQLAPLDGSYPLDIAFVYDTLGRFSEAEWMYDVARTRDPHSETTEQLYRMHLALWQNSDSPVLAVKSDSP